MSVIVSARPTRQRQVASFLAPLVLGFLWLASGLFVPSSLQSRSVQFQGLVTTFLGIFIEALPFLLAGVVASVVIQEWVTPATLTRWVPSNVVGATFVGSLLGLIFPVCECGAIPAGRRLLRKGAVPGLGMSFALAAPVVNPVVMLSTMAAFNDWRWAAGRVGFTIIIAMLVSLILSVGMRREAILAPMALAEEHADGHGDCACGHEHGDPKQSSWRTMVAHGSVEFFEMVQYLIIGGVLAATMQTFVPQSVLISLTQNGALGWFGPILAAMVLMLLAVVLSVCSTVDAFLALSFLGLFHPGAVMAFLVFGPMIDIKSGLMLMSTFRKPIVLAMTLLAFSFSLLAGMITYVITR